MDVVRVDQQRALQARGVVIVIDVIRAFTVAAYAFAGGIQKLWLVRTVEEALELRTREPEALLAGEIGGRLIPGFDFNNSPTLIAAADVRNRVIIQRTGAGTQGAVAAANAAQILLCSLTNARATATYARQLASSSNTTITLLPTATYDKEEDDWNEDELCADYIEALLTSPDAASAIVAKGISRLYALDRFHEFKPGDADVPIEDIDAILAVDRFAFAIQGERKQWQGITYVEASSTNNGG